MIQQKVQALQGFVLIRMCVYKALKHHHCSSSSHPRQIEPYVYSCALLFANSRKRTKERK